MHQNDAQTLYSPDAPQRVVGTVTNDIPAMHMFRTSRGRSTPVGATPLAEGVNFVLMCRHGTSVHLIILRLDSDDVLAEIPLDPRKHRTGDLWHIHVYDPPLLPERGLSTMVSWSKAGKKGSAILPLFANFGWLG